MRDYCLIAGIHEHEFWDMTVGEAVRELDAFQERRRDRAYFEFTNAMAVSLFVGTMFGNKHIPKLYEIYPELFPDGADEEAEAEQEKRTETSMNNFLKFAKIFNQRYENNGSDRTTESEDNG